MAVLLGGGLWRSANLNCTWTWKALSLKLCLYDKNIPFLCYQHFEFLFFAKFFFNSDSLISHIFILTCFISNLKKGPKELIRAITNYETDKLINWCTYEIFQLPLGKNMNEERLKLVKNILQRSLGYYDICPKSLDGLFCETLSRLCAQWTANWALRYNIYIFKSFNTLN